MSEHTGSNTGKVPSSDLPKEHRKSLEDASPKIYSQAEKEDKQQDIEILEQMLADAYSDLEYGLTGKLTGKLREEKTASRLLNNQMDSEAKIRPSSAKEVAASKRLQDHEDGNDRTRAEHVVVENGPGGEISDNDGTFKKEVWDYSDGEDTDDGSSGKLKQWKPRQGETEQATLARLLGAFSLEDLQVYLGSSYEYLLTGSSTSFPDREHRKLLDQLLAAQFLEQKLPRFSQVPVGYVQYRTWKEEREAYREAADAHAAAELAWQKAADVLAAAQHAQKESVTALIAAKLAQRKADAIIAKFDNDNAVAQNSEENGEGRKGEEQQEVQGEGQPTLSKSPYKDLMEKSQLTPAAMGTPTFEQPQFTPQARRKFDFGDPPATEQLPQSSSASPKLDQESYTVNQMAQTNGSSSANQHRRSSSAQQPSTLSRVSRNVFRTSQPDALSRLIQKQSDSTSSQHPAPGGSDQAGSSSGSGPPHGSSGTVRRHLVQKSFDGGLIGGLSNIEAVSDLGGFSGFRALPGYGGTSGYGGISGYGGASGHGGMSGHGRSSSHGGTLNQRNMSGYGGTLGHGGLSGYGGISGHGGDAGNATVHSYIAPRDRSGSLRPTYIGAFTGSTLGGPSASSQQAGSGPTSNLLSSQANAPGGTLKGGLPIASSQQASSGSTSDLLSLQRSDQEVQGKKFVWSDGSSQQLQKLGARHHSLSGSLASNNAKDGEKGVNAGDDEDSGGPGSGGSQNV